MLVEVDGLAIVLEGQIEVPIGGVDVPDQVVRIGRIAVELEGLLRRRHRAIQVSLRDQLPAAV